MLLQDSLGGNAKALMIANLAPSPAHATETLSSLAFASKVLSRATVICCCLNIMVSGLACNCMALGNGGLHEESAAPALLPIKQPMIRVLTASTFLPLWT
jgi:hypothetical protein